MSSRQRLKCNIVCFNVYIACFINVDVCSIGARSARGGTMILDVSLNIN